MCKCRLCSAHKLSNINYISFMGDQIINPDNPVDRAKARLLSFFKYFLFLFKYVGLFLLGIIVGMGIVLKNPMPDKVNLAKIAVLEKENKELKEKLIKNINEKPDGNDKLVEKDAIVID